MKKTNLLSLAVLTISAIFCISGQTPRKELHLVPETQQSASNSEAPKEKPVSQKPNQKSAAKRSMESDSQTSMNQKSAAKRSME